MSNEDKHIRHSHVQMKVRLPHPTTIYVAKLDTTDLPWLAAEGWELTHLEGVTYHGTHETRHTEWDAELLTETHYGPGAVYQKTFPAGAVELRGNNGGDGSFLPAPSIFLELSKTLMACVCSSKKNRAIIL